VYNNNNNNNNNNKYLIKEIQRKWNVKAKVVPVILGATGTYFKITQKIFQQHKRKARN
jgi:hypothetical protein